MHTIAALARRRAEPGGDRTGVTAGARRVRGRRERRALDRRLALGADPATDSALECRATELVSARFRTRLAVGFERLLEAAEEPPGTLSSSAPLRRVELLAVRGELDGLVHELRSDRVVRACGVAQAQRLLTDTDSPLYSAGAGEDVGHALGTVVAALRAT